MADAAFGLLARWVIAVLVFAGAVGVQLLIYGGALWRGGPLWTRTESFGRVSEYAYVPLVLLFFFGPGLVAGVVSFRVVEPYYRQRTERIPTAALIGLLVLTIVSCYLGVFISFNTWGT